MTGSFYQIRDVVAESASNLIQCYCKDLETNNCVKEKRTDSELEKILRKTVPENVQCGFENVAIFLHVAFRLKIYNML